MTSFTIVGMALSLLYILIPLVAAGIHARIRKRDAALLFFLYLLVIGVGVQLLLASFTQLVHGKAVAAYVGWPYSPFLREVAFANLAWGLLAVLSIWVRGSWRAASALGGGLFLFLAGLGHLYEAFTQHNFHVGNVGPVLWADLLIPLLLVIFLCRARRSL